MAIDTDAGIPSAQPRSQRGLSRRAVLGAAVAGGAGIAAVRLLGLTQRAGLTSALPAGRTDWISPLGQESARVMQLLRRATFGAGPADLERALGEGFQKTLDR